MNKLQHIFNVIAHEGFSNIAIQAINNYIKDIQNGTEDFYRFNLSEHAGLCTAGAPLIGASIIACYATASLTASGNAESREGSPANWEIDELQEQLIEQWAKAVNLWVAPVKKKVEKRDLVLVEYDTMDKASFLFEKMEGQSFQPRLSKPVIDKIDNNIYRHYGFTEEELDFIINYDIKYRMGDELNE